MTESNSFYNLIQRVRDKDADAATELIRKYEPAIRRAVRVRMSDTRLGAAFDSMDICQSVMASFFVRAASGQYDLDNAGQLIGLLVSMARKKLAMQVRRQRAAKRDHRRVVGAVEDMGIAGHGSTPSAQIAAKDLWQHVHEHLNDEEQQLVDLRGQGMEWKEIAEQLNGSPDALRMKLTRALDRVSQELGIDEPE